MKLSFISMTGTRGLKLCFDTDTKEYHWTQGLTLGYDLFYMPTNKDLYALEKKLIKEGFEETGVMNYGASKGN